MEFGEARVVEKPWGREVWLAAEKEYAGKILEINEGCRTSLQYHERKKESIYVYEGVLKVVHPGGEETLEKGQSITLSPGDRHRLVAVKDLILIEVSTPELDDIVRVEDDYGR